MTLPAVRSLPAPMPLPSVQPTRIDRLVARVAPGLALRMYESRVRLEAAALLFRTGGYNGARWDRPATKNWWPRIGSPDSDTVPDLAALRARSADLERNAPVATGAMNTMATQTIGTGIVPHARIDREYLGLTDDEAEQWERQADRIFAWWALSRASDLSGRLNFYAMQEVVLRGALGRGDLFALRRYKKRPGELLGLKLQLVEADRVCNPVGMMNTDRLVEGVELDEDGRHTAYWVLNRHPGDYGIMPGMLAAMPAGAWTRTEAIGPATGQPIVLQICEQLRPGQTRGVPKFAPIIETLKQLDRYAESELMAAVIASFFTVFIKSQTGEDGGLADMGDSNTLAQATELPGTANDIRLGQGAIVGLAPGEDIQIADPKRPNATFDPFFSAFLRFTGAALEIPYEILVKHFSASYSASRASLLEAWRAVTKRRVWLGRDFCQPVREWVLEEAIAAGLLKAPGFFTDPLVRAAYCRTEWTGNSMGQLDPQSEVEAAEKRVDLGISTLEEETAQLTGGDWTQKHAQRVKEHRMRVEAGLEPEILNVTTRGTLQEPEATPPVKPEEGTPTQPPAAAPPSQQPPRETPAQRERKEALRG